MSAPARHGGALRGLATTAAGLLPAGPLKNGALRRLGHDVHPRARIDPLLLVDVDHLAVADRAHVGAFSVVRHVRELRLDGGASLGPRNWVSAAPSLHGAGPSAGRLALGAGATVTTRHRLDCSGGITLGVGAAVAGWDTLVMTHDVTPDGTRPTAEPVVIGDRVFLHAANRVAAGTEVPAGVRTELGSVLTPGWYEPATRYGGNPAVPLGPAARTLVRERGTRVVHVLPTVDDAFGGPGPVLAAWLGVGGGTGGESARVIATVTRPGAVASRLAELASVDLAAPGSVLGRVYGNAAQLRRLRDAVRDADLVVSHSFFHLPGLAAAVLARRHGVPWAAAPHGSLDPWDVEHHHTRVKHLLAPLWRRVLDGAAVWCVTAREADALVTFGASPATEVVPCPTTLTTTVPVETALLTLGPLGRRLRESLDQGGKIVSFVGRFDLKKGLDRLVDAFDAAAGPHDVLVLAGTGEPYWESRVDTAASNAARREQIVRPGWIGPEAKTALWSLPGVFALVSDNENFGVAVAEAMACGRPVLVTDQVALAPLVAAAGAGCVTTLDHDDIVRSMQRLLRDNEFATRAGQNAIDLVRDQLSPGAVHDRLRDAVAHSLPSTTSPDPVTERIA
ncbi:glycosyltransferase [Jatrophihabitans sp. YIM 134969]